jgi:phosphonopyruvate decarboxylase
MRFDVLKKLVGKRDGKTIFLATTGDTGRELFEIRDAANYFYMVGSMGCLSSLALGLALAKPELKIVAVDGDGALLMRMGSMATIAHYAPANLLHVVLDNNAHASTGGQQTVSHHVGFSQIAESTGYEKVYHANNLDDFSAYFSDWQNNTGLGFLYLAIELGSKSNLGRPNVTPPEVKARLMEFINA